MSDDLYNDIKNFEASIDAASKNLESGEIIFPAHIQATLSAAIMISKAIMLLARTNRRVRRA